MQIRSSKLPGLLLAAFAGSAAAHDAGAPAEDRLAVSGGVGLMSLHADDRYPIARLPGVLEAGSPRADERRDGLDYAEIALRARFTDQLRAFLKIAHHGGPDARNETEEAWLDARTETAHDRQLALRAGRQLLPLGLLNPVHMHAWDFGVAPLAMRGAINESWRADGFKLDWQLPAGWSAGVGAWRNQGFPGADAGGLKLLTARGGWQGETLRLEAGYANVNADGRALLTTGSAGHTHSVPSCTRLSTDRVCFFGTAQLLTLAARWAPAGSPVWLGAEWWFKREGGRLDSINGAPDYTGRLNGGWLDLGWRFAPGWEAIGRAERLVARHELNGANAGLVASQSGIAASDHALDSLGAVLQWRPAGGHRLVAEWHRERNGDAPNVIYLLRYQYTFMKGLL
ncbi:MAG: hypothetical protein PHW25_12210 [Zoogloea sp.]|uniref:hypothetical protein n=1 Tax=Zoogloea sp. TaxID=49181 RepID=UPI002621B656|nr:hypothetical protein [Zoogloea sp.]MDD3327836.1 hypothetical protein [Zoogloea sp.]